MESFHSNYCRQALGFFSKTYYNSFSSWSPLITRSKADQFHHLATKLRQFEDKLSVGQRIVGKSALLLRYATVGVMDGSAGEEDEEDGGNEYKLRRFVKLIAYITLLFKVILVLVFWKDSLDFRNIIRQRKANPDEELDDILAQYENDEP